MAGRFATGKTTSCSHQGILLRTSGVSSLPVLLPSTGLQAVGSCTHHILLNSANHWVPVLPPTTPILARMQLQSPHPAKQCHPSGSGVAAHQCQIWQVCDCNHHVLQSSRQVFRSLRQVHLMCIWQAVPRYGKRLSFSGLKSQGGVLASHYRCHAVWVLTSCMHLNRRRRQTPLANSIGKHVGLSDVKVMSSLATNRCFSIVITQ